MKIALLVLLAASYTPAQTIVKGHHLGETVPEFLQKEPGIKAQLDDCHAKQPHPDQMTPVEKVACRELIAILETGSLSGFGPSPLLYNPMWFFTDGRLSMIYVQFDPGMFAEVEADLTKRIGVDPVEERPSYQNGYGASWRNQVANWLSSELSATLTAENNPAKPRLYFQMMPRSRYDATVAARAKAPSPLD